MGQFLAIGIITKRVVHKEVLLKYKISKEQLIDEMISQNNFEPSIYNISEDQECYFFNLKESVLHNELISFLEKMYPLVYPSDRELYEDFLEKLNNAEPTNWTALADERRYEVFQTDKYGMPDYVDFKMPFNPHVAVICNSILLSMEGKIVMEEYGRQFNFFKFCMQQTFPEFSIAKALRVYITG